MSRVGAGTVTVDGSVDGNVRIDVEQLTVADGATIGGDLTYSAAQSAAIAPGATICGQTERLAIARPRPTDDDRPGRRCHHRLATGMLVAMLLVGAVLILLFPGFSQRASQSLSKAPLAERGHRAGAAGRRPGTCGGGPVIGIFIGGWWLSPLLLGVSTRRRSSWGTWSRACSSVGQSPGRLGQDRLHNGTYLAIGLALLLLVGLVPILGWVIGLAAAVAGVGALTRALWLARNQETTAATASV